MWKQPGESKTVKFDGQELEMRPVSAGDYVEFLEACERTETQVGQMRAVARLVTQSAHKDGQRFFSADDVDELVRFGSLSAKNGKALGALGDAAAEACGMTMDDARKN